MTPSTRSSETTTYVRRAGASRRIAGALVSLCAWGLAVAAAVAFVPVWPCPLLTHFPVQLAVAGAAVLAGAAALRIRGTFDLAAIATLLQLLWLAPDLIATPRPVPDGAPLRVLLLNVHTQSSGFADVRRLIADVHPDVIGLVEVDRRWLAALAPAVADYPGRLESPRDDNFGVALYARGPLLGTGTGGQATDQATIENFATQLPSAVAHLATGGSHLDLVLIHPPPPITAAALTAQLAQLDAVADRVRQLRGPVVVMGDFNATPWSQPFRRVLARSGLCDSRAGFGLGASYPSTSTVLRIPIDHVLVTCSIGVVERRVERDVGSDHLPVVIDLVVPGSPR